MTLAAKKLETVQWILNLENEQVVDLVRSTLANIGANDAKRYFTDYGTIQNRKFDLEEVKAEQGYVRPTAEELHEIAREANIQESTADLLADLKSLD